MPIDVLYFKSSPVEPSQHQQHLSDGTMAASVTDPSDPERRHVLRTNFLAFTALLCFVQRPCKVPQLILERLVQVGIFSEIGAVPGFREGLANMKRNVQMLFKPRSQ